METYARDNGSPEPMTIDEPEGVGTGEMEENVPGSRHKESRPLDGAEGASPRLPQSIKSDRNQGAYLDDRMKEILSAFATCKEDITTYHNGIAQVRSENHMSEPTNWGAEGVPETATDPANLSGEIRLYADNAWPGIYNRDK